MAVKDYQDKLFDAISVVAESKVKSYHYDQTIEAVVKDDTNAENGRYQVEYTNGVFEAYGTGERYYKNDTVYVTIPRGDFTSQKFIIGRKVNIEQDPGTTFNFRMPFDDFIVLRDLTNIQTPARINTGYIANYPEHGKEIEVTDGYRDAITAAQERMTNITANWKNYMDTFTNNVNQLKKKFDDINYIITIKTEQVPSTDATGHTVIETIQKEEREPKVVETGESLSQYDYSNGVSYRQKIINIINQYVTIDGNWQTDNNAYNIAWNEINVVLNQFLSNVLQIELSEFAWDDNDLHIFLSTIESCYNLGHASQNASYQLEYKSKAAEEMGELKKLTEDQNNVNFLWSWTNDDDGQVLIETKLGISIDVQTLLGDYLPIDGLYGIRLVLTGTTKPTEEEMSHSITETIYFTNENMYGNTYGYYHPYTQQKIFDISNFLTLTHIDCYFWQELDENKHIFRDYNGVKIKYETDSGELVPPNIIIGNLKVILGLTTEEATSDRALLYCYEDEEYGIAPDEIDDPIALARSDEKTLRLAWIHISEDGPVLVDHEIKKNDYDVNSLQYWNAKIYWYNYQYGIPINESNEAEKYGGTNWKPKPFDQKEIVEDFTYDEEGNNVNYKLTVTPSREKIREKYRAVILKDNTPIRSNILEFTNRDVSVAEATFDSLYSVVFRFLKGTVSDQGTQMKIVQDNSVGNFFVYDENNDVISDEHGVSYSDIPYYVQIWIRNNETGDYSPATLDSENGIQEVNWDPFGNLSMITEFTEPSDSELENTELVPLTGDMTDEQKRILKLTTRRFKINSKWVMSYTNNFIRATVLRQNNKLYSVQKELFFGQSGTMGSPYTIVLQQVEPTNGEMIYNQKFKIVARIFERATERPNVRYTFMWQILSPTMIGNRDDPIIPNDGEEQSGDRIDGGQIGEWWHSTLSYENVGGYVNNAISGYIKNDMPLIVKCICKNCADYDISTTVGYGLVNNNPIIFNNNLQVQCPDRVEYKSDGTAPIADMGEFFVKKQKVPAKNQTAAQCKYLFQDKYDDEDEEYDELYPDEIYPEWKLFSYTMHYNYESETDETTGQVVQRHISEGYLSGGENSLNNSLSLTSREEIPATIATNEQQNINLEGHKVYKLNTTNDYSINGNRIIHGNSEAPANWYWDDSYATDYYVILQWKKTLTVTNIVNGNPVTESTDYWFKQAVPLTLNVYSSSLINTWDGKLLIDDVNNAILAKMIAAGTKNKDNQFNGIMMGDWASKGDSSFGPDTDTNIITGLYGFKNGRQVFSFRTDGTGFIGKSGKGQIQFDGNYSLISNADKTCYINLDPVYYKYNGQDIRIKNYNSYSQYFLWAESEVTTKTDGDKKSDYLWANKLLQAVQDTNRDLFVVDPNNGILTTGGIYAKYGRLGKYLLLNDSGLIYKQYLDNKDGLIINENLPDNKNNDIIYIGQERTRNGRLIPLNQTSREYDHYYWSSKSYENSPDRVEQAEINNDNEVGRYVIWVGNKVATEQNQHAYPKFGVEHDGTVHLTEAFVQGEIHAKSLVIGNEDVSEYQRNRGQKIFYTKIEQGSDAIGTNPALLKDEPSDDSGIKKWLWGGYNQGANTGTCINHYGDWLRPGDIWYIISAVAPKVISFKGVKGQVGQPDYENLYGLKIDEEFKITDYSIKFTDSTLSYQTEETDEDNYETINNESGQKHIIYNNSDPSTQLEYTIYQFEDDNITKYSENSNDSNYILKKKYYGSDYDTKTHKIKTTTNYFSALDITALEYKLSIISDKIKTWTKDHLKLAKEAYDNQPSKSLLNAYNKAMNGSLDLQNYYDTYLSMYNAIYTRLEVWAINLNIDSNDYALAKTSYSMSSLILDKIDQFVNAEENGFVLNNLPYVPKQEIDINDIDSESAILTQESLEESQTSYTKFVWEGKQNENDNHDWYGVWTESNALPDGVNVGDKIEYLTNEEDPDVAVTAGYIHPKYRTAKNEHSGVTVRWYDAPPGWRRVGVVDSESVWDALKHSTFDFNSALQSTTFQLTDNLNTWIKNLMTQMQSSKKEALEELNRQRQELTNMLKNLQTNINKTVFSSAAAIRNGMDPISFFSDGDCYVFVTNHSIDSNVSGIGMVPAGITVAQLPKQNSDDKYGSTFYLNSKRMGFYRSFNEKLDGETIKCNVPLLAYYNGSMALAGSMFFGLDYNNYIRKYGLNHQLEFDEQGNLPISTVASDNSDAFNYDTQYANISLYKNYIDGPNCRIVLGNGTIVLDGLDNGLNIEGKGSQGNEYPFPNALRKGQQEGGTPFVYIGANPNTSDGDNYKCGVVRIGAKDAGIGKLSLADFELASTSYSKDISFPNPGNSSLEKDSIEYTREVLSVLPEPKKTEDNKSVTINYIDSISIDGNSVSANYESETITLDRYKLSWTEEWSAKKTEEEESYPIQIEKINNLGSQSIEFKGDILAIAQKTTDGRYNGIGIVGSDKTGLNNSKILLGPIRYKENIISSDTDDTDIIDIKGYNDTDSNDCWLVGWNFYGLNILGKNIYASKNIYANGKIFIYDSTVEKYFKILHQSEVFNLVKDSENRVIGVLNANLDNINSSLYNVYGSLNDHSEALDTIADILEALSKGLNTVAGGVTKALGASKDNTNGIGDALNTANLALQKTAIGLYSNTQEGTDTSAGMQSLYLTMAVDPTDSREWYLHENNIDVIIKDIGANSTHSHGIITIPSNDTLEHSFRIGGVWDQLGNTDAGDYAGNKDLTISGGLEWEKNPQDDNRMTMLKSTIKINDTEIILGREFFNYFVNNDDMQTFNLEWQEDNKGTYLQASAVLDGTETTLSTIFFNQFVQNKDFETFNLELKNNNNGRFLEASATLNGTETSLSTVFYEQTVKDIIDEYSYNQDTIKQMVEEAFKKGWEDGWTNIRLEPELSEITGSSSNTFSVWAHFDTYTCQYGTEITGRDGMLAGQKRINFDIKDFQYWQETAFERFNYNGNNKITAMAKDLSTELDYTYAYLNVKTYQIGSQKYQYSIRTGQYNSGTEIASGEIGAVAAYNDGYDDGYIAGWQNAVNSLKAKLTHTGGDDASGNVIATASIESQPYKRKTNSQDYTLFGNSDTDSAYLSFSKGSEGTAKWKSEGQISTVAGQSITPTRTATYYRDISTWITDHSYGSLTWS